MKKVIRTLSTVMIAFFVLPSLSGCGYKGYKKVSIDIGTIMIPNEWELIRDEDDWLCICNEAKEIVMVQYKGDHISCQYYDDIELGEVNESTTYSNSATYGTVDVKIDGEWSRKLFIDTVNEIDAGLKCVIFIVISPDVDERHVEKIANSFSHY
ncbi:MAG: hypothetical protein IJT70_00260 [Clostridia bacterium]|nr:hypothetical protein [Clostridia bacterium]MBR0303709.1 hypothetical protein [Clostridia bacterium]